MLFVAKGAAVTAITNGSYYDHTGAPLLQKRPRAINADGMIGVYGTLTAENKGKSGKAQVDGNQGMDIYAEGKMIIDKGGKVYATNSGKNSNDKYGGSEATRVKHLEVGWDGYLYAHNYNEDMPAMYVEYDLNLDDGNNHVAVFTYPYDAAQIKSSGQIYRAQLNAKAPTVIISGLHRTTLYLREYGSYKQSWVYRDDGATKSQSSTESQPYTSAIDLTGTTTATYGYNSILPLDYQALKNIVVESGSQTIKLNKVKLKGEYTEPYITVKSGATLTLLIDGFNCLETKANVELIRVEAGGTLYIKNGSSATFASLSIRSSAAIGIDGREGLTATAKSFGDVYVDNCILKVRGCDFTLIQTQRLDILANLTIGSGAYVDANVGAVTTPSLTMNGGTLVGRVAAKADGSTPIKYSGIGNLQLTNADEVKVVDAKTGEALYPVEVTLYDEYGLFSEQTYTAQIGVYNEDIKEVESWRMRMVSGLTIARSGSLTVGAHEEAGRIPLHLTGAASEKQNCKLTVYLKVGDLVTAAKIMGPATSSTVSYWTSAAKNQQIIAKAGTTAKGALYAVGHLLMKGGHVAARRGTGGQQRGCCFAGLPGLEHDQQRLLNRLREDGL